MRIAITGGRGRIGHVTAALAVAQGHTVVNIDQTPVPVDAAEDAITHVQANTTNYDDFERALWGCQALIHLGAIISPFGYPDHVVHNNNVTGSYNALSAAARLNIMRVCLASSVNATGLAFSRKPHFDFFPLNETHRTYNEDPYSLSKWICEQQADSFARRYERMTISTLRFHMVVPDAATARARATQMGDMSVRQLWGYTEINAAARSCLQSVTASFRGHEAFYIIGPDSISQTPSVELAAKHWPDVPVTGDLSGHKSFFDSSKAERLLGWKHDLP